MSALPFGRSHAIARGEAAKHKYVVEYLAGPQAWTPQLRSFEVAGPAQAEDAIRRQFSQAIVINVYEPVRGLVPLGQSEVSR